MRNNKIFKAIAIAAPVLLSSAVFAQTLITQVNFTAVDDVQINPDVEVEFGTTVIPIAGRSCTMTPTVGTSSATAPAVTVALTGDGCSAAGTGAAAGGFALTGAASSEVIITLSVSDVAETQFTYTPEGFFLDGAAAVAIDSLGTSTVNLTAAGTGYITLGGDLDINTDMAFSGTYDADFTVEVTY